MKKGYCVMLPPAELARVIAKCEARLGVQHFFSPTKVVVPSIQVLQTLEQKIENEEKKFHTMYTQLFAKAISSLKSSQDLRRF